MIAGWSSELWFRFPLTSLYADYVCAHSVRLTVLDHLFDPTVHLSSPWLCLFTPLSMCYCGTRGTLQWSVYQPFSTNILLSHLVDLHPGSGPVSWRRLEGKLNKAGVPTQVHLRPLVSLDFLLHLDLVRRSIAQPVCGQLAWTKGIQFRSISMYLWGEQFSSMELVLIRTYPDRIPRGLPTTSLHVTHLCVKYWRTIGCKGSYWEEQYYFTNLST